MFGKNKKRIVKLDYEVQELVEKLNVSDGEIKFWKNKLLLIDTLHASKILELEKDAVIMKSQINKLLSEKEINLGCLEQICNRMDEQDKIIKKLLKPNKKFINPLIKKTRTK